MTNRFVQRIRNVRKRWIAFAAVIAIIAVLAITRREEQQQGVQIDYDPETIPTMLTRDAISLISDSGYIRYNIKAPVWYVFDEASEPNWKFNDGLYIEQYDDNMNVSGTFRCDSAIYKSRLKLWEFVGNVRMHNVAGDRFLTQQLFWDENARKINSDSFIHIEKSDRIIEGYGFTSDDRIENYTVTHPTMIIPVTDFNRNHEATDTLTDTIAPQPQPTRRQRQIRPSAPSAGRPPQQSALQSARSSGLRLNNR